MRYHFYLQLKSRAYDEDTGKIHLPMVRAVLRFPHPFKFPCLLHTQYCKHKTEYDTDDRKPDGSVITEIACGCDAAFADNRIPEPLSDDAYQVRPALLTVCSTRTCIVHYTHTHLYC